MILTEFPIVVFYDQMCDTDPSGNVGEIMVEFYNIAGSVGNKGKYGH